MHDTKTRIEHVEVICASRGRSLVSVAVRHLRTHAHELCSRGANTKWPHRVGHGGSGVAQDLLVHLMLRGAHRPPDIAHVDVMTPPGAYPCANLLGVAWSFGCTASSVATGTCTRGHRARGRRRGCWLFESGATSSRCSGCAITYPFSAEPAYTKISNPRYDKTHATGFRATLANQWVLCV